MVSLIVKNQDDVDVGFLSIDATPNETHNYESTPTLFPVETGVSISDHIRKEPEKIDITGMVTNSPVVVLSEGSSFTTDNAQLAFDLLEEIYVKKYLVDVVTRFKTYFNMVMSRLSIPRTRETGDAISFSISFIEIVKISSEKTQIDNVSQATTGPAAGTNKQGPSNVKKQKQAVADSPLYDLGEAVGLIGG